MKALLLSLLLVAPNALAQLCFDAPHEYCQIGCEGLGEWTVEPVRSIDEGMLRIQSMDGFARISAFAIQLPRSFPSAAIVRRPTSTYPATPPDLTQPGLRWETYTGEHAALVAAAEADVLGGWIYAGNDGATVIRIWWQSCGENPERLRPIRR